MKTQASFQKTKKARRIFVRVSLALTPRLLGNLLGAILCILLVSPNVVFAKNTDELSYSVRYGIVSAYYETDLEQRWRDDLFFGSLLSGGLGFSTEWENKGGGGSAIGGSIFYKDFEFFLDSTGILTKPSWIEYVSVPVNNVSTTAFSLMDMELLRGDSRLGGSWTFFKKDEHRLRLRLFRKSRYVKGDLSGFGIFSVSTTSIPLLRRGNLEALAAGFGYGLGYSYVQGKHEFLADLSLYSLNGYWNYNQSIFSTASLLYAYEDGNYKIRGSIFEWGYKYRFAENWKFFILSTGDASVVTDSDVMNFTYNSSNTQNPLSFNFLTYPGSAQTDALSTLSLGVEYVF